MEETALLQVGEYVLKKVAKTFGRSLADLEEDVRKVQEWLQTQRHLPEIMDRKVIENFLLLNKCSVEKTKPKLDMYYTIRTQLDDIYDETNPSLPHMKELMDIIYYVVHPKLTEEMYRVFLFKVRDRNLVHKLDPGNILRHLINVYEMRLREDVLFGDVFIVDCEGLGPSYLVKMTPMMLYKTAVVVAEKLYSLRVKGFYILNLHPFGEKILMIVKKIVKPKLFSRIHVCSSTDILKRYFSNDMVPKDFGGEGPSLAELQDQLLSKFEKHRKLFDYLDTLRVEENLRPAKLRNDENLGYYGNFKRLDID